MLNKIFKLKVYHQSPDKARDIMRSRQGGECFFVNENGPVCSLADLSGALKTMPGMAYLYHANKEKNDFANWAINTLGDEKLADALRKCINQKAAAKRCERRLAELQKLAK